MGQTNDSERTALIILRDALDQPEAVREDFARQRCQGDEALQSRVLQMLHGAADVDDDDGDARWFDRDAVSDEVMTGAMFGPFRIVDRIGKGGMGVVYRGERAASDFAQTVAIKLIRRGFDFDDVQARFLRERRILARLDHPMLARFIDGGFAGDGRPWFALEFVRGDAITAWCDARAMPVAERVRLFLDVCEAVQYAHTQLVVHRDLKPGNILVGEDGKVRLLDFGIARLLGGDDEGTAADTLAGLQGALTPEYAAPEQFEGSAVGVAADVYALGAILYELVAGAGPIPIDRHDVLASRNAVRDAPPDALTVAILRESSSPTGDAGTTPSARLAARSTGLRGYRATVRGDLSRILMKALAKEPERRYGSVDAFAGDLSRWLAGAPVKISGNSAGYRLGKFVRRNRMAVMVATLLALGLVTTSAVALHAAWSERQQREAAVAETARTNAVRQYIALMFREAGEQRDAAAATARDVLKRGADGIVAQFESDPATGQEIALSLADLYLELGDIEGARPLLERLLDWPGVEGNPDVLARARYSLAQASYSAGDAKRARQLLDAAQSVWVASPERYRRILNESRVIQSQLERAEGHPDTAVATLQQMIAERRSQGADDREVGSAFNSLTSALHEVGRYDEAIKAADDALAIFTRLGVETQAAGIATINNRAVVFSAQQQWRRAADDFRRVAALRQALYGRTPELSVAFTNLAVTLTQVALGEPVDAARKLRQEAIGLMQQALSIAIEGGGEAGRPATSARMALAELLAATGNGKDALDHAETAVRIARDNYGAGSVVSGLAHRARAFAHMALGQKEKAAADVAAAKLIFTTASPGAVHLMTSLDAVSKRIQALPDKR